MWPNLLPYVGAAGLLVSLMTGGALFVRSSRVTALTNQVNTQSTQISDQAVQIASLRTELAEVKAERDTVAADLTALKRVVTGEVQWQVVIDLLHEHHKAAEQQWRSAEEIAEQIVVELRRLAGLPPKE